MRPTHFFWPTMTESKFACPHCQKAIRVPTEMAGKAARCPLCTGVFRVPDVSSPPRTPSPTELQFSCPCCGAAFQVERKSLGQAVACPICQSPVQLPASDTSSNDRPPPMPTGAEASRTPSSDTPLHIRSPRPRLEDGFDDQPIVAEIVAESTEAVSQRSAEGRPKPVQPQSVDRPKTVDELLPPKFESTLPDSARNVAALGGMILREPVRKVVQGDRTRQIVSVAPEVKARRRLTRNLIMFALGSALLLLAAKMLIS